MAETFQLIMGVLAIVLIAVLAVCAAGMTLALAYDFVREFLRG